MNFPEIYSATGMMELIQKIGFLPLLDSGIEGFSAEDIVAEDCGYVRLTEGGWDWPLWKWKGEIVQEMPCMYGKFFNKKAGFISQEWWPDFCNNHEYGWGWSLLNTPEDLYGREACQCNRTPQESYQRIFEHLKEILPDASDKQIFKLIG